MRTEKIITQTVLTIGVLIAMDCMSKAFAADIEAVLDSADGSSAFTVKDSDDAVMMSVASDGETMITGTLTVESNLVVQDDENRGSGPRSMLTIDGGQDVEIGAGANGYNFGTALGDNAVANNSGVAMGAAANGQTLGTAVGFQANGAIAGASLGAGAYSPMYGSAIGYNASGANEGVAVGYRAKAGPTNIAIGAHANSYLGNRSVAIGAAVTNDVDDSVRIRGTLYLDGGTGVLYRSTFGSGAWTAINIGDFMADGSVSMSGTLNLGGQAITNVARVDFNSTATAIGRNANAEASGSAFGATSSANNSGVAVGYQTRGETNGVAVGSEAWGYNRGVAMGYFSDGYEEGIGLGYRANGARSNIAIGAYANARSGANRIAIGHNVTNQVNNSTVVRGDLYLDGAASIYTRPTFGSGVFSVKAFTIDHPLDPENQVLRHYAMEGPDVWNVYAGNAELVNGEAVVELPDYYTALNLVGSEVYSLTPIGALIPVAVKTEVSENRFSIMASQDIKVSWSIKVLRNDPAALEDLEQRPVEQPKSELLSGQATAETVIMNTTVVR